MLQAKWSVDGQSVSFCGCHSFSHFNVPLSLSLSVFKALCLSLPFIHYSTCIHKHILLINGQIWRALLVTACRKLQLHVKFLSILHLKVLLDTGQASLQFPTFLAFTSLQIKLFAEKVHKLSHILICLTYSATSTCWSLSLSLPIVMGHMKEWNLIL